MDFIPKRAYRAFTLLELLIVVVIIGILAAVAIPSYITYTQKARFSEVVDATKVLKTTIGGCVHATGATSVTGITACGNGQSGVPAAPAVPVSTFVQSITIAATGAITATATTNGGLASQTYILTPTVQTSGSVTWVSSGTGVTQGLAN